VVLGCRGSRAEAIVYGASLSLWQRRLAAQVDAFVVPSRFALERLHALGAPVGDAHVVAQVVREFAAVSTARGGEHAVVTSRLAPEKGIDVAIEACRIARLPLVIAGDGPERGRLEARFPDVRLAGRLDEPELGRLRAEATVALMPSRSGESFGLAAAEAMAAGLPVVASRIGALPELVPDGWLVAPDDPQAMAATIGRVRGDESAGERAIARAREIAAPEVVAPELAKVYAFVTSRKQASTGS
jgi:glycosyltransferase involved in cell wall biosynthesis